MSEKDKVKFIKVTKSQRKLLLADQEEFNELMNFLGTKLQAFRDKIRKARVEDFADELGITEAFQDGEWSFDTKTARFIKQDKITSPPESPEKPPGKPDPKKTIPNSKNN